MEINDISNSVFESIMAGLNEALDDAEGKKPLLKRNKVTIEPAKVYEASDSLEVPYQIESWK